MGWGLGNCFRDSDDYVIRLHRLNRAFSDYMSASDEGFDFAPEILEVMFASYSMWKHIQKYMANLKIPYDVGYVNKNLYRAIKDAWQIQKDWGPLKAYNLPDEARLMECVSRSAYDCLKRFKEIE